MPFDTEQFIARHPEFMFPMPAPAQRKRRAKRSRKSRAHNYASANRPATDRLHTRIAALLEVHDGLTLRDIGEAMGISRQLARYHVLKMVAHRRLVVIVEPCEGNGGVQYRVYERAAYAAAQVEWLHSHRGVAA
jgi:predicted ArsR family transcriptional regulator